MSKIKFRYSRWLEVHGFPGLKIRTWGTQLCWSDLGHTPAERESHPAARRQTATKPMVRKRRLLHRRFRLDASPQAAVSPRAIIGEFNCWRRLPARSATMRILSAASEEISLPFSASWE